MFSFIGIVLKIRKWSSRDQDLIVKLKEKLDKKMKEFGKKLKELKEERGDHLREFEEREAS